MKNLVNASKENGAPGSAHRRAVRFVSSSAALLVLGSHLFLAGCGHDAASPTASGSQAATPHLALSSEPTDPRQCPKGRLDGYWIKNTGSETEGRIEAFWIRGRYDTVGVLTGRFWQDTTRGMLFDGTVSGRQLTLVLFEVSGTWSFDDPRMCPQCGSSRGLFKGVWRDTTSGRKGRLSGVWGDLSTPFEERRMVLTGLWTAPCRTLDAETLDRAD
jgi:hypothetical protein